MEGAGGGGGVVGVTGEAFILVKLLEKRFLCELLLDIYGISQPQNTLNGVRVTDSWLKFMYIELVFSFPSSCSIKTRNNEANTPKNVSIFSLLGSF